MKKILLVLTLLASVTFAFEIEKSTTFTKNLEAELMSNTIVATIKDNDKSKIADVFKEAIKISKDSEICTNGSYSIYPNYAYTRDKNNQSKRVFNGYNGRINFECKFDDTKKLDSVIDKMDKITPKKDTLKLTINPIKWIVKDSSSKAAKDELELMALKYIYAYQNYLSKVYKKQCSTKKVSLSNNSSTVPMLRNMQKQTMKLSQGMEMAEPIKDDFVVRYNASYIFECK